MRSVIRAGLATVVVIAGTARADSARLTVETGRAEHGISPTLWGIFFEDINLSADGGIYPELVRNRSLEDAQKPEHWTACGRAELAVDDSRPINPNNTHALRVTASRAGGGAFNGGYWGMGVQAGDSYRLSLWARGGGALAARLENYDGSVVHARAAIGALKEAWGRYEVVLTSAATDPKARLAIVGDRAGTFWVDMVSLLPEKTWKGHGLRVDLCEMLAALKPAFMRFPGGCWVEGNTMAESYRWKRTIGDIAERVPLWNLWGYKATHGLGYHEYLQLAEDLGAEPMFCINVGMSHHEVVPMDKMDEYVQDALDAVEYANGSVTSRWGALRAKAGHPAPFNMKYMEIGNENGGPAYHERWPLFVNAIKAKYPEMQLIANVWGGYPTNVMPDIIDEHYYNAPEFFIRQFGKYDTYDRKGPKIFVGEYAVTRDCGQGNLAGALGEAVFMAGMERNSDIVTMAAYAPLFVNVNHRHWNPDLINFDSSRAYGLPSYYVQRMFAVNRGDVVLPVTLDAPLVTPRAQGGAIGVGTWRTQAEFKDIRVTEGDKVLFASDFSHGTKPWRLHGGKWDVKDGTLRQTAGDDNVRAFIGDPDWKDYTLTLKARKLGGDEGFLISFRVRDENAKSWWNLGGWGNQRHALEMNGVESAPVNGRIETGRWYDIRVEVRGGSIKCYLDGKLIHEATVAGQRALYAAAARAGDDVILKVVNVTDAAQTTQIELRGARTVAPEAAATVLTSTDPSDENTLDQPTKVAPVEQTIHGVAPIFSYAFPANSLTVLRVAAPAAAGR